MKKTIVGCLFTMLILCVSVYFVINKNDDRMIYENNNDESHIVNTKALTMMYETEAGSGEYQVSNDTTWPQDGYIFNERLSGCENGGALSWNSEKNRVIMQTNSSSYVYFDAIYTVAMMITDLFNQGSDELANLDPDGNIRYVGENPNNYVQFNNELWRIIGIFDNKLKIIRNDAIPVIFEDNGITIGDTSEYYTWSSTPAATADFFYWNYNGTNNWETSTLNIYLNGTYYNSIEQESKS